MMPISKNKKFFYLLYGESTDFKLASIDNDLIDEKRQMLQLAVPVLVHISDKPFPGTNMKTQVCAGKNRCAACYGGHKPTKLYPTHMIINGSEHVFDLPPMGHLAVLSKIQELLDNGATTDDILNTTFKLSRMPKKTKPYYTCAVIPTNEEVFDEVVDEIRLVPEDMDVLKKLDAMLKQKNYTQKRGSVILTLREKYGWTDAKIEHAFETVLDDEGHLKNGE